MRKYIYAVAIFMVSISYAGASEWSWIRAIEPLESKPMMFIGQISSSETKRLSEGQENIFGSSLFQVGKSKSSLPAMR